MKLKCRYCVFTWRGKIQDSDENRVSFPQLDVPLNTHCHAIEWKGDYNQVGLTMCYRQ